MPNSFTAGSSSKGKASSTQYLVMTGATLASMNARTRFTTASSSAVTDSGALGNHYSHTVHANPMAASLIEHAMRRGEATLAENGALVQMIENDPDAVIVLRPKAEAVKYLADAVIDVIGVVMPQ